MKVDTAAGVVLSEDFETLPISKAEMDAIEHELGPSVSIEAVQAELETERVRDGRLLKTEDSSRGTRGQTKSELWRKAADRQVKGNLLKYINKMEELGEGVWYESVTNHRNGSQTISVYKRPPNFDALKFLIERAMGPLTQKSEIDQAIRILSVQLHGKPQPATNGHSAGDPPGSGDPA